MKRLDGLKVYWLTLRDLILQLAMCRARHLAVNNYSDVTWDYQKSAEVIVLMKPHETVVRKD